MRRWWLKKRPHKFNSDRGEKLSKLRGGAALFPLDVWLVVLCAPGGLRSVEALVLILGLLLARLQDLEGAHERFIDAHHAAGVVELAAVVGGGEEGDQLTLGEELVPVLNNLMGPADKVEVVSVEELAHDVGPEGEADATVVLAPTLNILVRIRPQEVAQQACVGNVCWPHDPSDLLHALEVGTQAAVAAEDLLVNYGCNG